MWNRVSIRNIGGNTALSPQGDTICCKMTKLADALFLRDHQKQAAFSISSILFTFVLKKSYVQFEWGQPYSYGAASYWYAHGREWYVVDRSGKWVWNRLMVTCMYLWASLARPWSYSIGNVEVMWCTKNVWSRAVSLLASFFVRA